jgi:hypothetical protein
MLAHRHYSEQTVDMERVLLFVLVGYFVFCFLFYFYFYSFFLFFSLCVFFLSFLCNFTNLLLLWHYGIIIVGLRRHHWTNMPDTGHILYNKTNIAKLLKLFIYLLVVFFSFVCRLYCLGLLIYLLLMTFELLGFQNL